MDYDDLEIEIRFHSPDDPVLGARGEEAKQLAFPEGNFASEIEYEGRRWGFHHTDLLRGPNEVAPSVKRLVYVERKSTP